VLLFGKAVEAGKYYGPRTTFADIGETVLAHMGLESMGKGQSIL
jgi:phosphopentomutase